MTDPPSNLDARLTKARLAMLDGRWDEGVEELRKAIFDAARLSPREGRRQVEEVLRFAKDNDAFEEMEDVLETDALRHRFFGGEE